MSNRKRGTYEVIISETLRYAVTVTARSKAQAERLGTDLWHERMQAFRCISDGGIEHIHAEKIGGGQ